MGKFLNYINRLALFIRANFRFCLHKIYKTLRLYELRFFFYYLIHRYRPEQMELKHISRNIRALLQVSRSEGLDSTRHGKLLILSTKWQKFLFFFRNLIFFRAPFSRVVSVVYFTYATLTLELNNPFDKRLLTIFLEKKIALLQRLLTRVEKINGKMWNQSFIKLHIEVFHRNSLLQYHVIENMHEAVRRQKKSGVLQEAKAALEKGLYPILVAEGLSGSYWMRGLQKQVLGLFKPFDEEIHAPNNPSGPVLQGPLGQRRTRYGCRVGEAAHHEVGAFVVDAFFGFGIVPRTYYAKFTHRTFFLAREDRLASFRPAKTKYGSFQEFLGGFVSFSEVYDTERNKLPLVEFQLLVVLDVIIGNTDRNTGNILLGDEKIAAIDHGLCFPDGHSELCYWYWGLEMGAEPLIPSLVDLLTYFPFEALFWKLKKNCCISTNSLDRLRERVVLFTEAVLAGLVPRDCVELMKAEYLDPLREYKDLLQEKAKEQLALYTQTT